MEVLTHVGGLVLTWVVAVFLIELVFYPARTK
jgi:hypothetical protein